MSIEKTTINNLRILSLYEIERANSGHPGIALGASPIFYSLYANVLNYDSLNPNWLNRDRFVNSAGHSSSLNYATLHAFGFNLEKEDLMNFRQLHSKTPGHPEYGVTDGVDCSTGPLGQGVANSVGMAMAQKHLASIFNKDDIKIFDSKIYCFVGDGCLMEGISYEALSLAGNLNLDNLVLIYDRNCKTIEGNIDITFSDNIELRFNSIGFHTFFVENGNDQAEITKALLQAKKNTKPSLVVVNTKIGFGSHLEDNEKSHGTPFTLEEIENVKKKLGIDVKPFELREDVKAHCKAKSKERRKAKEDWLKKLNKYKEKYPDDYLLLQRYLNNDFNAETIQMLFDLNTTNDLATRDINFEVLNNVGKVCENLFGGSADVATSTKAYLKGEKSFSKNNYSGKNIHFGIREHAMAGICNGIALFGGILPFCSCFLSFSDYLKPSLRMSAQMGLNVLYIFTHDSIMIGEDGPTHQSIEQLTTLRTIPNLMVFRPYNESEIIASYIEFLKRKMPLALVLSKHKTHNQETKLEDCLKGAYVISGEREKLDAILIATGMEVELALNVQNKLQEYGIDIRVISMPCMELFLEQEESYKESILPFNFERVISLEAGSEFSWNKFTGKKGLNINLNNFGKSAKPKELAEYVGFTTEKVAERIKEYLKK